MAPGLSISNDQDTQRSLFDGSDDSMQRNTRSMVGKCPVTDDGESRTTSHLLLWTFLSVEDQSPFEVDWTDSYDSNVPRSAAGGGSGKGGARLSRRKIPDHWSE